MAFSWKTLFTHSLRRGLKLGLVAFALGFVGYLSGNLPVEFASSAPIFAALIGFLEKAERNYREETAE